MRIRVFVCLLVIFTGLLCVLVIGENAFWQYVCETKRDERCGCPFCNSTDGSICDCYGVDCTSGFPSAFNWTDCGVTELPEIDARDLYPLQKELRSFALAKNSITIIPSSFYILLDSIASFSSFDFSYNKLTSVPSGVLDSILRQPRVINFDFTGNEITQIPPLGRYPPTVNLSTFQLSSLPSDFSGCSSLILDGNRFSESFPSNAESVEYLSVRNNNITRITDKELSKFPHLRALDLSYNKLTELPSSSILSQLQNLTVEGNSLRSLSRLTSLQSLHAARNQISSFSVKGMRSLIYLDMRQNKLTSIPDDAFQYVTWLNAFFDENYLKSLPSIPDGFGFYELNVAYNNLTVLPSNFGDIDMSILNLSHNHITRLFSHWDHLEFLDASYNNLTMIPSPGGSFFDDYSTNVRSLYLGHNSLKGLPASFSSLEGSLMKLDLSNNSLKRVSIDFSTFHHLEYLNFSNNKLSKLPSLPSGLSLLDVRSNRLNEIDLSSLKSLRAAYANDNCLDCEDAQGNVSCGEYAMNCFKCNSSTQNSPRCEEDDSPQVSGGVLAVAIVFSCLLLVSLLISNYMIGVTSNKNKGSKEK